MPGRDAIGRHRRQRRARERAVRLDEVVLVVQVAAVDALVGGRLEVDADDVLARLERVVQLERRVVRRRRVGYSTAAPAIDR